MKYSESDVEEFLTICEELKMQAWGYELSFESGFHADVFHRLDDAIRKLKGEFYDCTRID